MEQHNIEGYEFDWYAVDSEGHIGHFATAGFGPIPAKVNIAEQFSLQEFFNSLEEVTECELLVGKEESFKDWIYTARRGLFSYDWKHWKGPYLMIARPKKALKLSELPTWAQTVCQKICFKELSFQNHLSIAVEKYFHSE